MDILVCAKAVPVTAQVQLDGQLCLRRDGVKLEWNLADASALEAALQLKGAAGSVTVLTMGPAKLEAPLRELLARGADRAVLLTDPAMAGADTYATGKALAQAAKALGCFDLILCGAQALDGETGQVPGMLAGALELPCVTGAENLRLTAGGLLLERSTEQGYAKLQVQLPAVVSLRTYSYTLRLPGILAMRKARQKQVELLTAQELGISPAECGLQGSLTQVVGIQNQFPGLRNGEKQTDPVLGVQTLLRLCKEVGG